MRKRKAIKITEQTFEFSFYMTRIPLAILRLICSRHPNFTMADHIRLHVYPGQIATQDAITSQIYCIRKVLRPLGIELTTIGHSTWKFLDPEWQKLCRFMLERPKTLAQSWVEGGEGHLP